MSNKNEEKSFWSTVPGILTGIAAIITAISGLIIALNAAGIITIFPPAVTPIPTPTITTLTPTLLTPTPTTPVPTTPLLPDLFVSEFSLDPSIPIQDNPVSVRIGVYNQGTAKSNAFTVQWWAGENFTTPACTWRVDSLVARGGRILTCTYDGYVSWYSILITKVVVDSAGEVSESNKSNNIYKKTISVSKA